MSARSSKLSIPAWQQEAPSSTSASADTPAKETTDDEHKPTTTSNPPTSTDRSDLLEQAKTFIADPEIRDATTSRKIAFLESKGLTNAEIEALLGVSRNEDTSQTSVESKPTETQEKVTVENDNTVATAIAVPSTTAADSKTTPSPSRDVPPIITYPEFLTKASAQNKPPLLSLRSVVYTLYGAAGIGATFYGASELLVKPMLKSLGDARHELFNTAVENLSGLNEKLEGVVSRVPPRDLSSGTRTAALAEDKEDVESISSDPTEVFHRDIATQTTSDLLNDDNNNTAIKSSSDDNTDDQLLKTVDTHKEKLTAIRSLLQELVSEHTDSGNLNDTMRNSVSDLQSYLDGLKYSSYNSYLNNNNNFYNNNTYSYSTVGSNTSPGGGGGGRRSKEEDAISAFRAEIRGVKGALLSARNFPSGRPAGIAR